MMSTMKLLFFVLLHKAVTEGLPCGTCGLGCDSDCDNADYGSCGNACCKLDVTVSMTMDEVVDTLNATLTAGGTDGQFTASALAEGVSGFADLRPYDHDVYIGQFMHTTAGAAAYNDSISLTVGESDDGSAVLRLFSYSLVGGAYGDAGQNYKNLQLVLDALSADDAEISHTDTSCPDPTVTATS